MNLSENYTALGDHIAARKPGVFKPFTGFQPRHTASQERISVLAKLLLNAWSAEYALRITPVVNDEQYLQSSLHWTFPQAYYSVLFTARAFLASQGFDASNEALIRKRIANYVARGFYPNSLNFYAMGGSNIAFMRMKPDDQLRPFLRETRMNSLVKAFNHHQTFQALAFRTRNGLIVTRFSDLNVDQLRQLSKGLGYTTYFDLMSRLRISSNHQDIEEIALESIDVRAFHAGLVDIVGHINSVHETYIALEIGIENYQAIVDKLPSYLQENFVRERAFTTVGLAIADWHSATPERAKAYLEKEGISVGEFVERGLEKIREIQQKVGASKHE